MITNKVMLEEFYNELDRNEKLSHKEALAIFEALHKEAVSLGVINHENMMEGIEVNIRIAKAINSVK